MCWWMLRLEWCSLNMEAEATSQGVQATSRSWRRQGKRFSLRCSRKEQERKKVKSLSHVQLFATPWTVTYQAPPSWNSPGKSAEVGCHFLLQRIFPIQGSNPGSNPRIKPKSKDLPHCRQKLYQLSHQGSQKRTEPCQLLIWAQWDWF